MALVVQTNNAAITALKHLNTNNINMNKSLERLSSGFRINAAADDAAGFAVSSKLDSQNVRLKAAALNVAQASAMVKTADAGVNEIQNMIVRLQSLTTQALSANNDGELANLDAERSKLVDAIDKISASTKYNGVSLLNGTAGTTVSGTPTFTSEEGLSKVTLDGARASTTFTAYLVEGTGTAVGTVNGSTDSIRLTDGTTTQTIAIGTLPTGQGTTELNFSNLGITLTINAGITGEVTNKSGTPTATAIGTITTSAATNSTFQVGADTGSSNQISVAFDSDYSASGLSIAAADGDITSVSNATTYAALLSTALDTVISNRATLGASQNQLGFVSANLATSVEQITAAVSNIRDADMAAEMASFTKNQILTQAGTAMLAQANQASQNVLSLFR
jgi:flagellin